MDDRFEFLVGFLTAWAWQALGKVPHPATGKIEQNLETARRVIDVLEMVSVKTAGNLSQEERRLLDQALTDLRLNYVDEKKRAAQHQNSHGTHEPETQDKTEQSS